ncbi:MAG: hypothetical protein ACYTDT_09230 [Planctomycetota bacterium]|jgi:tetratricopeptide (TPR) repeat protein
MRFAPIVLLILTSCVYDDSYEYEPEPEHRTTYDASPRNYYEKTYVPPSERSADWFADEAEDHLKSGDYSEAHISYHRAFRRDRWHPRANSSYQNMMLQRGLFDEVWREYLDLWQQDPERGDACLFHLRPMFVNRGVSVTPTERRPKVTDETQLAIDAHTLAANEYFLEEDFESAIKEIDSALSLADLFSLHKLKIKYTPNAALDALASFYTERSDEDPSSGNNLALLALVTARTDTAAAFTLLRDGYVMELRGLELPRTMAELARDWADASTVENENSAREQHGWYSLSAAFFSIVLATQADDIEAKGGLDYAIKKLAE